MAGELLATDDEATRTRGWSELLPGLRVLLIRCPLLMQTAQACPLIHRTPITRGRAPNLNTFATMHGHQRGRGTRDPELLMRARRTGVLLHAGPIARGAPSNLEALVTMGGPKLEGVGSDGGELELLVGRKGPILSLSKAGPSLIT